MSDDLGNNGHDERQHWVFDKKINLTALIALFLHSAGLLWVMATFMAQTNNRLEHLEQNPALQAGYQERLVRVETKIDILLQNSKEK